MNLTELKKHVWRIATSCVIDDLAEYTDLVANGKVIETERITGIRRKVAVDNYTFEVEKSTTSIQLQMYLRVYISFVCSTARFIRMGI